MKKYLLIVAVIIITAAVFPACNKGNTQGDTARYISGDMTGTLTDFDMFAFFNDEMVPFTPHYSSYDGTFGNFKLDSLELFYNEKTHELRPVQADLLVYDYDGFMDKIFFTDYNFDGFVDVAFRSYFGPFGRSEIFLYNPHTNVFYRHEELSDLTNARIDEEKQIISSFDDGGDQGMIFDICEYKWIHDNFTLIYSDRQEYDADLGLYVRIIRTLQGNGTWTEERETHAALFDSGTSKLLERIITDRENLLDFEYDNQNRIVKISHYRNYWNLWYTTTITYNSNSVTVEKKPSEGEDQFVDAWINFEISGDSISYAYGNAWAAMTVNDAGFIITNVIDWWRAGESENFKYEYIGGNPVFISETHISEGEIDRQFFTELRYDNKPSPFNCNTPKWLLQLTFNDLGFKNNIIYLGNNITDIEYQYEYDSDSFPSKRTMIHAHGGIVEYETTLFMYYGEVYG